MLSLGNFVFEAENEESLYSLANPIEEEAANKESKPIEEETENKEPRYGVLPRPIKEAKDKESKVDKTGPTRSSIPKKHEHKIVEELRDALLDLEIDTKQRVSFLTYSTAKDAINKEDVDKENVDKDQVNLYSTPLDPLIYDNVDILVKEVKNPRHTPVYSDPWDKEVKNPRHTPVYFDPWDKEVKNPRHTLSKFEDPVYSEPLDPHLYEDVDILVKEVKNPRHTLSKFEDPVYFDPSDKKVKNPRQTLSKFENPIYFEPSDEEPYLTMPSKFKDVDKFEKDESLSTISREDELVNRVEAQHMQISRYVNNQLPSHYKGRDTYKKLMKLKKSANNQLKSLNKMVHIKQRSYEKQEQLVHLRYVKFNELKKKISQWEENSVN